MLSKVLCLAALMVVLAISAPLAKAQDDVIIPACVDELAEPCGPFVNSTTAVPPTTCCQPLQMVIQDELPCLCSIFSSLEVIQALSLNVTEALTLPQRCGFQFDLVAQCEALAPSQAPAMAPSSGLD